MSAIPLMEIPDKEAQPPVDQGDEFVTSIIPVRDPVNAELFPVLRDMKKLKRGYSIYRSSLKLLEIALKASELVKTKEEQAELEDTVRRFDPIMWDLLKEIVGNSSDFSDFLRRAILTFDQNRLAIRERYEKIVNPHLWGNELAPEYRQYAEFANAKIPPMYSMSRGTFLVFVVILTAFILYLKRSYDPSILAIMFWLLLLMISASVLIQFIGTALAY